MNSLQLKVSHEKTKQHVPTRCQYKLVSHHEIKSGIIDTCSVTGKEKIEI